MFKQNKTFSKVGNSTCVILSKAMLEQANLKENDNITISIKKDLVTIRKQKENWYKWKLNAKSLWPKTKR